MSSIEKAIKILIENGFQSESDKLTRMEIDLYSDDKEKILNAANEIYGVCIMRAWGDLNIKTMNGFKWNYLLDKIKSTAKSRVIKTNAQIK